MQREGIADALREVLAAEPDQDKRQLLTALRQRGLDGPTTTDVNSVLYSRRNLFASDGGTPPRWRLTGSSEVSLATYRVESEISGNPRCYCGPEPRAWQREALKAWLDTGRRGSWRRSPDRARQPSACWRRPLPSTPARKC